MTFRIYNTATRQKEDFHPLEDQRVGLYACGVTVYDLCHIGHARSALVFDVLVRYLRARGYRVTYVRNFTDVDDKIIARANETGRAPAALAQQYIDAFCEDMGRLGILPADEEPRATDHIDGMVAMIETLVAKGYAYAEGRDVFFDVEKFEDYGRLSGRRLEDMQAGSRIAVDASKHNPLDFVLWKGAKPGEPQWESPWGAGRPGWHIECSVMCNRFLGATFDIHGGGRDLLFPHHENERAQSIAAQGGEFARYWVHNGFVTVDAEKMSKSLGNFLTIRDALEAHHPQVLRLFLLSKHYRTPLDFSLAAVAAVKGGLVRIYRTLQRLEGVVGPWEPQSALRAEGYLAQDDLSPFLGQFVACMDDDLNTSGAVGAVFEHIREMNRALDACADRPDEALAERLRADREELYLADGVLEILRETPRAFFEQLAEDQPERDAADIDALVRERDEARAGRDWARADAIRGRLKEMGVVLEDSPQGTIWRYAV